MIGVIILNFEDWSSTERTLKSILQHESNLSILIVDNGSKSTRSYFGTNDHVSVTAKLAQKYEFLLNQKQIELNVRRSDQNLGFQTVIILG